ncbi:MAG: DUF1064 domain-containing protein [Candidatus Saccharimonadales bacterium]
MAWRRHGKFNNIKTVYNGRQFDSKKEANHAAILDALRRHKEPKEKVVAVQYQYKIPLVVNGMKVADYYADFYVSFGDGRKEIHDVKGVKTAVYNLKKKMVKAIYGEDIKEF